MLNTSTAFTAFTKQFFATAQSAKAVSLLDNCRQMFKSAINDGMYSMISLEKTLSDILGSTSKLFDFELSVVSGTKLAVTAATDTQPTARLFTN